MQPGDSPAFKTLQAAITALKCSPTNIRILLYDNTPGGQDTGMLPTEVLYKADLENAGLAKAYNYALEIACNEGFDWLLTLDQDTSLPNGFLTKLCDAAAFAANLSNVAAIVPWVSSGGCAMSPWIPRKRWMRPQRFPRDFIGVPLENVFAANSASTVKVSALKAIGGYDPRFRLFASDLVMYHRLHCNNFRVFVSGNIHVEHEISISDLKRRSTPDRYREMLSAEEAFYDEYLGWSGYLEVLLILLHRVFYRLWTTGGSLAYFKIVLKFLCRRLFYSRRYRMETSEQAMVRKERSR